MKNYYLLLTGLLLGYQFVQAQEIKLVKVEFLDNNNVYVYYDLSSAVKEEVYKVSLFAVVNNIPRELGQVSGEIGEDIRPGFNKKITWNPRAEFNKFKGEVLLEVKASLVFSPLQNKYDLSDSYKRGATVHLEWKGGVSGEILNIELYQGTEKIEAIATLPNTSFYNWIIPGKIKKGTDYHVKIGSQTKSDNAFVTNDFAIKSKIPLALKVLPLVVIGGIGAAILGGGSGSEPTPPQNSRLPEPPSPK